MVMSVRLFSVTTVDILTFILMVAVIPSHLYIMNYKLILFS